MRPTAIAAAPRSRTFRINGKAIHLLVVGGKSGHHDSYSWKGVIFCEGATGVLEIIATVLLYRSVWGGIQAMNRLVHR
jgi:hypothetical protein